MLELAERCEAATAEERYDWTGLPSWAAYGGEHHDNGWVPDCGGKVDFDPGLLRLSCRVWRDGAWICSVYFGADFEIESSGIQSAPTKAEAKRAVEAWCDEASKRWAEVVAAALRARAAIAALSSIAAQQKEVTEADWRNIIDAGLRELPSDVDLGIGGRMTIRRMYLAMRSAALQGETRCLALIRLKGKMK